MNCSHENVQLTVRAKDEYYGDDGVCVDCGAAMCNRAEVDLEHGEENEWSYDLSVERNLAQQCQDRDESVDPVPEPPMSALESILLGEEEADRG